MRVARRRALEQEFECRHLSIESGKISVGYPKAWEGTISGKTTSGGISVTGEGVNIIRVNNGIIYKEIVAKKGVDREGEGSNIEMITTSGGIKFTIA